MRILLTGSNGLLGQKLVLQLVDQPDLELLATSRGPNRHPMQQGYRYEPLDLTDETAWQNVFEQFQPDTVINTAAVTQVDLCEDEQELCDLINVEAVQRLARLCAAQGSHLVHISTDFVFDGAAGPYRETDAAHPVNYYGLSKLKAEEVIQAQPGLDAAILRTILLYGVTPAMSRSNIVLWAKGALEAGKPISVVNDQWRCPTLAEDLATATLLATRQRATGLFHISGEELMSVAELVRRVAAFWQLDASLISETDSLSLNQRAKRPPRTGFILDKAKKELGYAPHSFEAGLQLLNEQLAALA